MRLHIYVTRSSANAANSANYLLKTTRGEPWGYNGSKKVHGRKHHGQIIFADGATLAVYLRQHAVYDAMQGLGRRWPPFHV